MGTCNNGTRDFRSPELPSIPVWGLEDANFTLFDIAKQFSSATRRTDRHVFAIRLFRGSVISLQCSDIYQRLNWLLAPNEHINKIVATSTTVFIIRKIRTQSTRAEPAQAERKTLHRQWPCYPSLDILPTNTLMKINLIFDKWWWAITSSLEEKWAKICLPKLDDKMIRDKWNEMVFSNWVHLNKH